jgi:adenosylhomocysteine nucleosidase
MANRLANALLGVISALPEEFAHLSDRSGRAQEIGGLAFWRGEIAGREAVFVESGAGKVNAGVATALLLDRFDCRALLLCGVAGGLDPALGVGDVVVGASNTQHDYGVHREDSFRTIQPGSRPSLGQDWTPGYRADDALVARLRAALDGLALAPLPEAVGVGQRLPSVHFGAILTGDSFVNSEPLRRRLHAEFQAQAVEMEGGAVAQIAHRWGADIPFVNVRCLSDLAGSESHLDFRAFLPVASRYASQVAHSLAPAI